MVFLIVFANAGCKKKKGEKTDNDLTSGTINVIFDEEDNKDSDSDKENEKSPEKDANSKDSSDKNNSSDKNSSTSDSSGNKKPSDDSSEDDSDDSSDNSDKDNEDTDDSKEYKKINCRSLNNNEWKTIELVVKNNKFYTKLDIPNDWEIESDNTITRSGIPIGKISTKASDSSAKTYEENSRNNADLVFKHSIKKYKVNNKNEYKRNFSASRLSLSGSENLFLIIDYAQLDNSAAKKLYNSFSYLGIERTMPAVANSSTKFLILGNSFIQNSKISDFLSDMLITDGKGYTVDTRVIGGAEVSNFAEDTELINKIKSGEYAYVFQGCFYSDNNSWGSETTEGPLKTIIDACNISNTGLIIFPAHNEPIAVINRAMEKYNNIYCINWKEEINSLINSGIGDNSPSGLTEADFCIDDFYKHSTPLAGYVGAHMLYKNIFGTMPPPVSENAPLSMSMIDSKLLRYSSTGLIPGQSKILKYYI